MMRAGISFADWRAMAPFQRRDWMARRTIEQAKIAEKLKDADVSTLLSFVFAKFMES